MTTLIAWASVDSTGVSALNIASDSRFSWTEEECCVVSGIPKMRPKIISTWDGGKKLFCCRNTTDFFGFSGQVVTQSTILSQIVDAIDFGVINLNGLCPISRHDIIQGVFRDAYQKLDKSQQKAMAFLHGYRECRERNAVFHLWETGCADGGASWRDCKKEMPQEKSAIVASCGTGGVNPGNEMSKIQTKFGSNVSSIVQSLSEALRDEKDSFSGGLIQLAKIDRIDLYPQPVGLAFEGSRFFQGLELGAHGSAGSVDWRDRNYTFLNGETLLPKSGAIDQSFRSK